MTLSRSNKFTAGSDRDKAFLSGRRFSGQFIDIKVMATKSAVTHMAIFVPVRVATKAVSRNRVRRKIAEAIKALSVQTKPGYDVIVLAKTEKLPPDNELMSDALTLWKKSDMLKQ